MQLSTPLHYGDTRHGIADNNILGILMLNILSNKYLSFKKIFWKVMFLSKYQGNVVINYSFAMHWMKGLISSVEFGIIHLVRTQNFPKN